MGRPSTKILVCGVGCACVFVLDNIYLKICYICKKNNMETPLQIPKEQLKHCPYCGAQIPLVSNECLFCGKSLTNITKSADEVTPNDDEIKNCPDCGAPFPLLSNICTSCGHVLHQQRSSEINITNLLAGITECINRIKN